MPLTDKERAELVDATREAERLDDIGPVEDAIARIAVRRALVKLVESGELFGLISKANGAGSVVPQGGIVGKNPFVCLDESAPRFRAEYQQRPTPADVVMVGGDPIARDVWERCYPPKEQRRTFTVDTTASIQGDELKWPTPEFQRKRQN